MKRTIFLWCVRVVFVLSLFFVFFSISQMVLSKSQVEKKLNDWEREKPIILGESEYPEIKAVSHQTESDITGENKEDSLTTPLYTTLPKRGELIGKITIPKIDQEYPIVHGTDEKELSSGVGHYIGSVLPGEADNTVLAGHRDTVFKDLGSVEIGDVIEVETTAGKFTYEITNQRIVDKDDRTVIVPYGKPVLTLITCYPFDFIGSAPERFILVGELVH